MADEKRYSVEEAAKELGTGVSTLLLWKHIYSEFLSATGDAGDDTLSRDDIHLFTYISECTESGLTREEIRLALRNRAAGKGPLFSRSAFRHDDDDDILALLDDDNPTPALLARLVIQQRRLAEAEERKASAMERRIAVEEEKSRSLAAILNTLQTSGIPLAAMAGQAPQPSPESPAPEPPAEISPAPESPAQATPPPSPDNTDTLSEEPSSGEDTDDLWGLVNDEPPKPSPVMEMDNLWDLVETPEDQKPDDLWSLVDVPAEEKPDDLWALVDEAPAGNTDGEMDNLWDLVDEKPSSEPAKKPMSDTGLDDLWTSDEPPAHEPSASPAPTSVPHEEMDNLWDLVDTPPQQTEPAPSQPRQAARTAPAAAEENAPLPSDPEAYKDFILKEIIGMKRRERLSAAQVAERLNKEERPTFSGKGSWGTRTIEGIFRIIEKAGPA